MLNAGGSIAGRIRPLLTRGINNGPFAEGRIINIGLTKGENIMLITNRFNLPESIVRAVTNDTYTGPKADSEKVSVTTLIGSPRIHFLKCKYWAELSEDVVDNIWKILGSAAHAIMERADYKDSIQEERLEKTIDGLTISGAFDLYDGKTQELHDYKTTSAYTIVYNPNGKEEWIKQMNIYAYLLADSGFPVKACKIIAILRDHSASKVVEGGNYPPIPIHILDIPLWDKDKAESYIKGRVEIFKASRGLNDDKLPACTKEEMWEKDGSWAIMKDGRKSAVKVCATEAEAKSFLSPGCFIVERPGERTRCDSYCPVNKYCDIYKSYKAGK